MSIRQQLAALWAAAVAAHSTYIVYGPAQGDWPDAQGDPLLRVSRTRISRIPWANVEAGSYCAPKELREFEDSLNASVRQLVASGAADAGNGSALDTAVQTAVAAGQYNLEIESTLREHATEQLILRCRGDCAAVELQQADAQARLAAAHQNYLDCTETLRTAEQKRRDLRAEKVERKQKDARAEKVERKRRDLRAEKVERKRKDSRVEKVERKQKDTQVDKVERKRKA